MSIVETVLKRIQILPPDKQQTVLDFIEFLVHELQLDQTSQPVMQERLEAKAADPFAPQSTLGKKLYSIRQRAISEGIQLLTDEEIDAEIANHRRHHIFYEDVS